MSEKNYPGLLVSHFAVLTAALGALAGLHKIWENLPWWADFVVLAIAPVSALLFFWGGQGRHWIIKRCRDKLHFPTGTVDRLGKVLRDLLDGIPSKRSGLVVTVYDPSRLPLWVDRVLKSLHDSLSRIMSTFPTDAYVLWLKADSDLQNIRPEKGCNVSAEYLSQHIHFGKADGLAGTVWESGEPAMHSANRPHPAWHPRPGCDNASYVCVPVGRQGGPGGVLGFGSNTGFEVTKAQVELMRMFAAVLALAAEATPKVKKAGSNRAAKQPEDSTR
jgi:hypothetical protein